MIKLVDVCVCVCVCVCVTVCVCVCVRVCVCVCEWENFERKVFEMNFFFIIILYINITKILHYIYIFEGKLGECIWGGGGGGGGGGGW